MSNLYRDSAATLEQFQNAQTGYQLAEQALQIAGFNQRYSSIYATESGRVLQADERRRTRRPLANRCT